MKSIEEATLSEKVKSYIVDPGSGDKIECYYQDPTDEQRRKLAELEEKTESDDVPEDVAEEAGKELEELIVDDLFLSDKVTTDSGLALKQAVIAGLFRGLGKNDAVEDAMELMEDLEGNQ